MPTNDRAEKGEKNKKTTDESIPGKEKAKNRPDDGLSPQASKPNNGENDVTDGGDENKKSNR